MFIFLKQDSISWFLGVDFKSLEALLTEQVDGDRFPSGQWRLPLSLPQRCCVALGPSCTPGSPATCQNGVHRLARLCCLASQRDNHTTHPENTVGSSLCHQGPSRGHGHLKYAKNGSRNMCLPAFHVRGGGDRSLCLGKASPIPRCPGWALSLILCMPPLWAPVPELRPFSSPQRGSGGPQRLSRNHQGSFGRTQITGCVFCCPDGEGLGQGPRMCIS